MGGKGGGGEGGEVSYLGNSWDMSKPQQYQTHWGIREMRGFLITVLDTEQATVVLGNVWHIKVMWMSNDEYCCFFYV